MKLLRKTLIGALVVFLLVEVLPYAALTALAAANPQVSAYPETHMIMVSGRLTPDAPLHAAHRLLFVGNSAAYGLGVDDNQTIEAYLQRSLKDTQVINLAYDMTANIAGELLTLYDTPIRPGDVIVSYDGYAEEQEAFPTLPVCSSELGLIHLSCALVGVRVYNRAAEDASLHSVARILALMRSYVKAHGATMLHVWQPTIWTQTLSDAEWQTVYCFGRFQHFNLTDISSVLPDFRRLDSETFDLTALLNGERQQGRVMFLDPVHTTAAANALIAQAILGRVYGGF